MAKTEVDYEIPSSASEFGALPELRQELVILPEWKTRNGKATAVYQCELNTGEHDECVHHAQRRRAPLLAHHRNCRSRFEAAR